MWFRAPRQAAPSALALKRPCSHRLRLEVLEERCLLSAGDLDPSFGSGGIVTTPIGTDSPAYALAIQPDGKILAGGTSSTTSGRTTTSQFALARYTTSGSLDSTFGTGGKVTTAFGKKSSAAAYAMALYPNSGTANDGKIVLAGTSAISTLALARYTANGSLDTAFGTGGTVTTPISAYSLEPGGVALQSDGKIVVAGTENVFVSGVYTRFIMLVRYNANGTLDTGFGAGGIVTTNFAQWSGATCVALQADGKIDVGGFVAFNSPYPGQTELAVARYNSNGGVDTTFGAGTGYGGFIVSTESSVYGTRGLTIQPDGKIVAVGRERYFIGGNAFVTGSVGRLNSDGSPDTTFGGTGIVTVPTTTLNELHAVALQPDGKVVVAGDVYGATHQVEVGRFNTDGSIDPTFGTGGLVSTLIGSSNTAAGVAIQADGRIVVAGTSPWNSSGEKFALARYLGDGAAPAPTVLASAATQGEPSGMQATLDLVAASLALDHSSRREEDARPTALAIADLFAAGLDNHLYPVPGQ